MIKNNNIKMKEYEEEFIEDENEDVIDLSNLDIEDEEVEFLIEDDKDADFDVMFKDTTNKHKLEGTHSLKRDTIFMGKLDEESEFGMEDTTSFNDYSNEKFDIEKGSACERECRNFEDYYYQQCLTKDVYNLLCDKTNIDLGENRRKPNKQTFNNYYVMCITDLGHKYTKCEIFVELSYYFTDAIFNMFKLLNKKNATSIILELKEKGYLQDIGNINFI